MDVVTELHRARESHDRQAWADAYDELSAVDRRSGLNVEDLERLAEAAHMLGRRDQAIAALQRAYQARVDAGEIGKAVTTAFWLQYILDFNGEFAHARGWIARAWRLIEAEPDCAERGYLMLPEAERQVREGDNAAAFETASRAVELGRRIADRDLVTIAAHIQGRARIRQGRVEEGLALLDEAMVGVAAGETSVGVKGWIYCSVIATCQELHELRRAREWTTALNAWCDSLPQFTGGYSGLCRIHRAELLRLGGEWPDAAREALRACEQLTQGYGDMAAGLLPTRRDRTAPGPVVRR